MTIRNEIGDTRAVRRRLGKKKRVKAFDPVDGTLEYVDEEEVIALNEVDESFLAPPPSDDDKNALFKFAVENPLLVTRELCKRDLTEFIKYFWPCVAHDTLKWNWHIDVIADEITSMAQRVSLQQPKTHDLIINIPPGMSKSLTVSVMFPVWCWVNWPWMRFICASYSAQLALEQADLSRELIRSDSFKQVFPEITIKEDKDTKSNYRIQYMDKNGIKRSGGNRYSTSVGGTLTGFHGHILLVDDPLNPRESVSDLKLNTANHWMEQTLSTRKVDKAVTPTILIMQRLHQDDPSGHMLDKKKVNLRHICLPGLLGDYEKYVNPPELITKYTDGFLDAQRLPQSVLDELLVDLGQYGFAGQIGQNPVPPGGGMMHVDMFSYIDALPKVAQTIRYWDKASSVDSGAYTAGVKMSRLLDGKFLIEDVKRGQWSSDMRERIIRATAEADGPKTIIWHEQEPGSGGKDSAQATTLNLAGYMVYSERATGEKTVRADPYSVQVNSGNVLLLRGDWNAKFVNEHRFYPFSTYKDQVDAASGAFNKLAQKRLVKRIY